MAEHRWLRCPNCLLLTWHQCHHFQKPPLGSSSDIKTYICLTPFFIWASQVVVKNLPANADVGSIHGSGRKWQPTPIFLPGKVHGQRSLAATVHEATKNQTKQHIRTLFPLILSFPSGSLSWDFNVAAVTDFSAGSCCQMHEWAWNSLMHEWAWNSLMHPYELRGALVYHPCFSEL